MNFQEAKQEAEKVLEALAFEQYAKTWGPENRKSPVRTPRTREEREYAMVWGQLEQFASPVEEIDLSYGGKGWWEIEYTFDPAKTEKLAKEVARSAVERWANKLETKVGASIVAVGEFTVSLFGEFRFEGMRGEDKIVVNQTSVHGWSCCGTPYWTFPARLYVNGKFTTEAAFNGQEKAPKAPRLSTHVRFENGVIMRRKDYEKMLAAATAQGKTLKPVTPFSLPRK